MIARILSVLAAMGLIASGTAKVKPAGVGKSSPAKTTNASQVFLGICTDGQPLPPPGCSGPTPR